MTRFLAPLITALATIATPATAQVTSHLTNAGCQLTIQSSVSSWVIRGYDPFGNLAPVDTFDLTFVNNGQGPCTFFPVFSLDREAFGLQVDGRPPVPYALLDMYSDTDATPTAGRTTHRLTQRSVVIAAGGQQVVRYQFSVAANAIDADGLYSQHVQVDAQDTNGLSLGGQRLVLGIDVLPSATMGLVGAFRMNQGQAMVDLGELKEGIAEVPLRLVVESTRRYTLSLESQNSGRLRLRDTEWVVPYQLLVDGRDVALAGGHGTYRESEGFGPRRDSLPLSFRIGDTSDRRAGTYGDVISISVAPD